MSVGPKAAGDTIRTALAMGADRGIHLKTDESVRIDQGLEPLAVAGLLKKVRSSGSSASRLAEVLMCTSRALSRNIVVYASAHSVAFAFDEIMFACRFGVVVSQPQRDHDWTVGRMSCIDGVAEQSKSRPFWPQRYTYCCQVAPYECFSLRKNFKSFSHDFDECCMYGGC